MNLEQLHSWKSRKGDQQPCEVEIGSEVQVSMAVFVSREPVYRCQILLMDELK